MTMWISYVDQAFVFPLQPGPCAWNSRAERRAPDLSQWPCPPNTVTVY